MQTRQLRQANAELRAFMKENNMKFNMTLKTFLEMVELWDEERHHDANQGKEAACSS